jgi:uncharacterized protein (DUF1800 family)
MPASNQLKNQHLLWRAAFGPMAENANQLQKISQKELYKLLEKTSAKTPEPIDVAKNLYDGLFKGMQDLAKMRDLTADQKKMIRNQSRQDLKNLNLAWLGEMINSEAQLREKMSLFWHGHFACRVVNIFFQQQLLDTIRRYSLGNFGALLRAVSKSPSMLSFLNNQQNKKQRPNENFAREVMELFTMGRGHYTEADIKEAARAFTGWGFNLKGEFVFKKFQHDNGTKTVLGKKGNFTGDDVIDILLEQKQTARYITRKIYKHFVNENIDEQRVEALATKFYDSGYEIKTLLENIYTSDWFYNEKNIGNRIKSPVELLVGIRRMLPMQIENPEVQLLFQKVLGQVLFYPPNVAGWPGGKNWIDSSSLMLRLRVPQVLTRADEFAVKPKADDDTDGGQMMQGGSYRMKNVKTDVDWKSVVTIYETVPRESLIDEISSSLLQTKSKISKTTLEKFTDSSARENYIKTAMVELMSTPEYQLC